MNLFSQTFKVVYEYLIVPQSYLYDTEMKYCDFQDKYCILLRTIILNFNTNTTECILQNIDSTYI